MPEIENAIEARSTWAREIAAGAGELTLRYFGDPSLSVDRKADDSPVTVADRQAEEWLRDQIHRRFPDDSILGEEYGETAGGGDFRWVLDPIDGTKSFICGVPLYGTLVAVQHCGVAKIGVIELPALHERVYACHGSGAWHQRAHDPPRAAGVSRCQRLSEAVFLTSDRAAFGPCTPHDKYQQLESRCRWMRTWGDCYGYALVATGRADLMVDPALSEWDAAALLPILQEAGGCFTDWTGQITATGGSGVGTNPQLLTEVLDLLR